LERGLVIPSKLTCLTEVRNFLEEIFIEYGLNKNYFNRVFLGLSEAVCNSIVHGNRCDVSRNVSVCAFCSESNLVLEVSDEGDGFPFDCIQDPTCFENLNKENGRGIFLIHEIADEVVFSAGGRKVLIRFILD
jgi:serine/threonine-protein kinase RsbW